MSTVIRAELSKKNQWYIPKHRYYELKHFCLQYPEWKRELSYLNNSINCNHVEQDRIELSRSVEEIAIKRDFYSNRIGMLNYAANKTDPVIGMYILEAVTIGKSYDALNAFKRIPACRDVYYELYRKFFYILSEARM